MFHNLFLKGASTTIDKIKKGSSKVYSNHEEFSKLVAVMSNQNTD